MEAYRMRHSAWRRTACVTVHEGVPHASQCVATHGMLDLQPAVVNPADAHTLTKQTSWIYNQQLHIH
eukprot:363910-Chlamydomonas_euryale.AAC.5